ncbi:MAG: glycosyltransferase family protein [Acidimicrobiales bacterium]
MSESVRTEKPSVQIQTVLYETTREAVGRWVGAAAQAARLGRAAGVVGAVRLVIGDSSGAPVLDDDAVDALGQAAQTAGVDAVDYRFFDANLGSAGGHNALFGLSATDLVLILNPDTVTASTLLERLVPRLADISVGIAEARQLPIEHPKAWSPPSGDTSWASGACSMLRRGVLDEVGGYDAETFFLYCDDVDLSWRVRLAGHRVVFEPSARVFHDKRLDGAGRLVVSAAEEYYAAEAALLLTHKWSRPDLTERYRSGILEHGGRRERQAVEAFDLRRTLGTLPKPLDADHQVGEFHEGGRWAAHRW